MGKDNSGKSSLFEACVRAVGGMAGGGIFVILGEAVTTAGNATFISLGAGGLLVLITGIVYAKLTVDFDEPGGEFTFIEHITGPRFAGTVSWVLMLGYIFTIGLYAYAFGAFADHILGIGVGPNPYLSSAIILFVSVKNVAGIQGLGTREYLLVYIKCSFLVGLIILGFFAVHPQHALPVLDHGLSSIIFGSALVFVGYEGFQLLTYHYDEIENYHKNLPKAIRYSIIIVIILYMLIAFVLTGSVNAETIARHKETALALIAQPLLGQAGVTIVLAAAVFATAFAVHTTVHVISHLAVRVAADGQIPHQLTDTRSGSMPIYFSGLVAFLAICMQFFSNLHQITVFCSMVFLLVFTVVNIMGFKHRIFSGWKNIIPLTGSMGCFGAFGVLLYHSCNSNPSLLYKLFGMFLAFAIARLCYIRFYFDYQKKESH